MHAFTELGSFVSVRGQLGQKARVPRPQFWKMNMDHFKDTDFKYNPGANPHDIEVLVAKYH